MPNHSQLEYENIIIRIATDNWRLMSLFMKVLTKLEASEQKRYMNQVRYFQKMISDNLGEIELKIVDLTNQKFDSGMAASPINIEDFKDEDILFVEQMIEPLIMSKNGIKKEGIVKLIKVEK